MRNGPMVGEPVSAPVPACRSRETRDIQGADFSPSHTITKYARSRPAGQTPQVNSGERRRRKSRADVDLDTR